MRHLNHGRATVTVVVRFLTCHFSKQNINEICLKAGKLIKMSWARLYLAILRMQKIDIHMEIEYLNPYVCLK